MAARALFADIRVLDLSIGIAGAYASKLLADQGADVLKIEDPARPDPLRRQTACGAVPEPGDDAALFRFLNGGKRSAFADARALLDLVAQADVVIECGEAPRLCDRVAAGVASLREDNPVLSVVTITPWGSTGPYAGRPASEWTLQAATGFMARRGRPELGHIGAGGRLGEYAAGSFAAVAAVAAWREAAADGRGRDIDLSLFEAMLVCSTQYWDLNHQLCGGELIQYLDIPAVEPAKDGFVGFSPQTSEQWQNFCILIERPELALDDRFLTANTRQAHLDFLHDAIHAWTRPRAIAEILEAAEALRVPASPVGNGERLPGVDHFEARGVFVENPHGFIQPRVPFSLRGSTASPIRRAPDPGADAPRWLPRPEPPPRDVPRAPGAFGGLRVIDLTAFWAGPFATSAMAQLGADVIKVESVARPDGMRFVNAKPDIPVWEGGAIFHGANPDKRAITLALDHEEGRGLLRRLIEGADILIENFSVRVLDNLGLSPDTLHRWNPRLIVVRMPAWGLDGPWKDRTGFAMNVEQAGGIAWRAGYAGQPLTANFCDPVGSLHTLFATFAALELRARTGRGTLVEVPLVEPALNLAAEQVIEYSAYGVRLDSEGNRSRLLAPQGIYPCGDGRSIAIAVRTREEWRALGETLGTDDLQALTRDPALDELEARHARHDEIDAAIARATANTPVDELAERLTAAGLPAEALINGYHLTPHPQLEHRRFFRPLDHRLAGTHRYAGLPFVGLADERPRTAPPTLGQHNREVLGGELGLDDEALAELEAKQVIGTRPPWA